MREIKGQERIVKEWGGGRQRQRKGLGGGRTKRKETIIKRYQSQKDQ